MLRRSKRVVDWPLMEIGMSASWNTKYGSRKVRHDPPTLAEAIAAAQGLTDDPQGQISFAADLMGVTVAEAKAELQKLAPDRRATRIVAAPARDKGATRTVVVERKASRRVLSKDSTGRPLSRDTGFSKR